MKQQSEINKANAWFKVKGWQPNTFQLQAWEAYYAGHSGLLNAPTGTGKTYALLIPIVQSLIQLSPIKGIKAIWITPIRALSKEIKISAERLIQDWNLELTVAIRTGDSSSLERQQQKKNPPDILITTPESWHILLSQKGYEDYFTNLKAVVVDEWHELLGSKRGVQVELALSRLKTICPTLQVWGISATIGNLEEAMQVLHGFQSRKQPIFIQSNIQKQIEVVSVLPEEIEKYPWAGHLGIKMLDQVIPISIIVQVH